MSQNRTTTGGSEAADCMQYLTFTLQKEEYGVEILKVQEIKGFSQVTPVPGTPVYVKGVINLRGTVVPVIDLRRRFGLTASENDQFAVTIVINVGGKVAGLVVDTVSDVLSFQENDVEATPDFGSGVDTSFITGMAKIQERLVLLLDADRLIAPDQLAKPGQAA